MVDYTRAIKRPFSDPKKLLIGIVLATIPIVFFIAFGYLLNCASTAMKKKFELPEWKDFKELFIDGFKWFVLGFSYLGVPVLLMLISSFGAMMGIFSGNFAVLGGTGIIFLIALTLFFLSLYVFPAATLNYASTRKIGDGLKFRQAFNIKYLKVWLVVVMYGITISMPLTFIAASIHLPYISEIVRGAVTFIVGVTAWTLFGEIFPELK